MNLALTPEQTAERIKLAYGLLWLLPTDTSTRNGRLGYQARQLLLQCLTSAERLEGLHRARMAQLRRCDSNLVDAGGECLACNAIQGEACRLPEPDPRKNPRTWHPGPHKPLEFGEN